MPFQVIYSSRAARSMSSADLEEILDDARIGNKARDVTGALIYVDGVFMQILEGERDVVERLIDSIGNDSRHSEMKVFHAAETTERAFSSWRMAYLGPSPQEVARWAGLEGSGSVDDILRDLEDDPERVPRILISIVSAIAAQR